MGKITKYGAQTQIWMDLGAKHQDTNDLLKSSPKLRFLCIFSTSCFLLVVLLSVLVVFSLSSREGDFCCKYAALEQMLMGTMGLISTPALLQMHCQPRECSCTTSA